MKKTLYLFNAVMVLILIFGIAGCASSPETEDQIAEEQESEILQEEDATAALAASLQREIEEARRAAEEAGAGEYYPEQFAAADAAAQQALDLFNSGDADAAFAEWRKALAWYEMLKIGMDIRDLRQKIIEYSFDIEDPEGFADAEAKYGEAVGKFELEYEQAKELSIQALAAYQTVCNNGFMRIAAEERARAEEIITLCDSIRAARSMPDDYQAASQTFDRAERLGEQGLWEDSCKNYREASILFAEVYQNAMYKRNAAEEAMNAARERQEASRSLALEADEIAPLPDDYEGEMEYIEPETEYSEGAIEEDELLIEEDEPEMEYGEDAIEEDELIIEEGELEMEYYSEGEMEEDEFIIEEDDLVIEYGDDEMDGEELLTEDQEAAE